jgi:hypothetical protein
VAAKRTWDANVLVVPLALGETRRHLMAEQNSEDEERLSTDDGIRPHSGTRIGTDPGHGAAVDISGGPGGSTGWGAFPKGMGTNDESEGRARNETGGDDATAEASKPRIGAEHGQLADSGVSTGPVGHGDG